MTDEKLGALFDPTALQWSGPDGLPTPCPFKRMPGPDHAASPYDLRKLGVAVPLPDAPPDAGDISHRET